MRNEPPESIVLSMSEDQLEKMMERAVTRALDAAGLPIEDKEDRAAAREDFRFLRRLRKATDSTASKIGYAIITVLTGGALVIFLAGLKAHLFK